MISVCGAGHTRHLPVCSWALETPKWSHRAVADSDKGKGDHLYLGPQNPHLSGTNLADFFHFPRPKTIKLWMVTTIFNEKHWSKCTITYTEHTSTYSWLFIYFFCPHLMTNLTTSTIFVLLSNLEQSLCEASSSFVFYMCSIFLSQELRTPHSLLHSSSLQTSKKKVALKRARDLNGHITKKDVQIFD